MANTQNQMSQPPEALSTKDLLYLKDALSWELLAFKKFHHLAQAINHSEIQQALDKAGKMHQRHYEKLLGHLQVNNTQAMEQFNQAQQ